VSKPALLKKGLRQLLPLLIKKRGRVPWSKPALLKKGLRQDRPIYFPSTTISRNLPYLKRDCDSYKIHILPPLFFCRRNLPYLKRDCDFFINNEVRSPFNCRNLPYLKRDCDVGFGNNTNTNTNTFSRNLPYLKRDCDFNEKSKGTTIALRVVTCPT